VTPIIISPIPVTKFTVMRRYTLTLRVTSGDHIQMGKYLGYAIIFIVVMFVLEWFQIVDVPFFEIPDFMSGKKDMIHSTEDVLEQM
jgi:hypothetical protein